MLFNKGTIGRKSLILAAVGALALVPAFSMAKSRISKHGLQHTAASHTAVASHSAPASHNTLANVAPAAHRHHRHHHRKHGANLSTRHGLKKQTVQNSTIKPHQITTGTLASTHH